MSFLQLLNTDKILYTFAMLSTNMGSRYVIQDVTKFQERVLASEVGKKFVLFCMVFVATRDVVLSIIITFAVICIMKVLLNEHSRFCIIPWIMIRPIPAMIAQQKQPKSNETQSKEEEEDK